MTAVLDTTGLSPLANCEWLAANLDATGLCIVDARKGDDHASAHVPGAVSIGESPFLRADGDVLGASEFARRMSALGIDEETTVIVYDDGNNLFAARLWWALHHYGHEHVRVLDGGWDAWSAAGLPTNNQMSVRPVRSFEPVVQPGWIADSVYVQASISAADRALLDVRSNEEWRRQESPGDTPAGHIAGARRLVWTETIDSATKRFKTPAELRALFSTVGVSREHEIIVYCLDGIRAAHTVVALKLAGFPRVRNYEGSWAAWSRAGLPIEAAAHEGA